MSSGDDASRVVGRRSATLAKQDSRRDSKRVVSGNDWEEQKGRQITGNGKGNLYKRKRKSTHCLGVSSGGVLVDGEGRGHTFGAFVIIIKASQLNEVSYLLYACLVMNLISHQILSHLIGG